MAYFHRVQRRRTLYCLSVMSAKRAFSCLKEALPWISWMPDTASPIMVDILRPVSTRSRLASLERFCIMGTKMSARG